MILLISILFIIIIINSLLLIKAILYKLITYQQLIKSINGKTTFKVNVFVPCMGWNRNLRRSLWSIARQDYQDYSVVFITEDEKDGAVKEIKKLTSQFKNCAHIISGVAAKCCQKNFNLLKGVKKFRNADIYVFCDSDIIVSKEWLRKMVAPLNNKRVTATTSFDSSSNMNNDFLSIFKKIIDAYLLFLMLAVGAVWGGSFAVRSKDFFRLNIDKIWKNSCVDDISIMRTLIKDKSVVMYVPAGLKHLRNNASLKETVSWWTRQIMYSKYYMRLFWVFAVIGYTVMALPVLLLPLLLALSFINPVFISYSFLSATILIFIEAYFTAVLLIKGEKVMLKSVFLMPLMFLIGFYSLITTVFKDTIIWGGREYKLDSKGRIKSIRFK